VSEHRRESAYGSLSYAAHGFAVVTLLSTVVLGWLVAQGHARLSTFGAVLLVAMPLLLARPENGLLAGAALVLLVPSTVALGSPQAGAVRVAVVLSLVGFLILAVRGAQTVPRFAAPDWLLFGLVAVAWISWELRPHVAYSMQATLAAVLPAGFYLAGRWFGGLAWQKLAATVLAAAAAGSVTVLYEFSIAHRPLFTSSTSYFWAASGDAIFRPGGVFQSPPTASVTLAMSTLVGASLLTTTRGLARRLVWLGLGVSLAGMTVTFTRAGVIAFAVGLALYLFLLRPFVLGRLVYAAIVVGAIVVLFVLPHLTRTSWYQEGVNRPGSLSVRESYWSAAWPVIVNSPLHVVFGHGVNSLYPDPAAPSEFLDPQTDISAVPSLSTLSPHSQYVRTLVEGGMIGLLLFVGWLGLVLLRAVRARRLADLESRAALAACGGVVATFLVASSVGDTLREMPCFALVALVAGSAVTLARNSETESNADHV
jgi:O-antigen ligase